MKRICILILACLFLTACQQASPDTIAKENQATIDAGVRTQGEGSTAQMQSHCSCCNRPNSDRCIDSSACQTPPSSFSTNSDNGQITKNTPEAPTSPVPLNSTPKIMFTYVPPLDSNEDLSGKVGGRLGIFMRLPSIFALTEAGGQNLHSLNPRHPLLQMEPGPANMRPVETTNLLRRSGRI